MGEKLRENTPPKIANCFQHMSAATCPICTRAAASPWRVYDAHGKVVQGCVSAFHTGHLTPLSESNRWHNSAAAKKIRRSLAYAQKYGYGEAVKKFLKNPAARFDALYRKGEKRPKWSSLVSPVMDANEGGKILRQRLPDWTKAQHVAEARKLLAQYRALNKAWGAVRDKEHLRVFKRPAGFHDYIISGIGRAEYSEKAKDKLRLLSHTASAMHAAAWAHWRAAGKRSRLT